MEAMQNLNLMLANLKNWLWCDIIVRYWWIGVIIVIAILLYLLVNWADKKTRENWNQIKKDLNQTEDDGHHIPRPPSSL